jgi:hypothetical protein
MVRLRYLLLAVVVALSIVAIGAGTAAAATGGNNDNAHACQQGGHESRFEAETGNAFKNAGACASHGAKGGAIASLEILTNTYPCSAGTCWGTLIGSGLKPNTVWTVVSFAGPLRADFADATGSVNERLNINCGGSLSDVRAASTTAGGAVIQSPFVQPPCG